MPSKSATTKQPEPAQPASRRVKVWIHFLLGNATEELEATENALQTYINGLLKDGFVHRVPGKTVIYPAHTITKIEVVG